MKKCAGRSNRGSTVYAGISKGGSLVAIHEWRFQVPMDRKGRQALISDDDQIMTTEGLIRQVRYRPDLYAHIIRGVLLCLLLFQSVHVKLSCVALSASKFRNRIQFYAKVRAQQYCVIPWNENTSIF